MFHNKSLYLQYGQFQVKFGIKVCDYSESIESTPLLDKHVFLLIEKMGLLTRSTFKETVNVQNTCTILRDNLNLET